MNRDEARALLPIIQAFAEGKDIEVSGDVGWMPAADLKWDRTYSYRIKPEPKLRPWTPEECPAFVMLRMKGHHEEEDGRVMCWAFHSDPVTGPGYRRRVDRGSVLIRSPEFIFQNFTRIAEDGTERPCGVLETQP